MKLLGLDVGTKRTGVAYADSELDIVMSLETIEHSSFQELLLKIDLVRKEKEIDMLIVGLPLLPSGEHGKQADLVEEFAALLREKDIPFQFLDERYTTPSNPDIDPNAAAACDILQVYLRQGQ